MLDLFAKIMAAHLESRNPGVPFDLSWFQELKINFPGVKLRAETIGKRRSIKKEWQAAWLLRAVSCMDLTTLSGKLLLLLLFLPIKCQFPIIIIICKF
jgi:hypothetical protein